ncbi:MAG: MobF family relaxase [Thermoleophilia bacterium]
MLTIRAATAPAYYERVEFARDDYYEEVGATPGRWVGRGADGLGLDGAVERGELATLLGGHSPRTGQPLGVPGRRGNAGFDLTFTAPKSVSLLAAVGDESVRRAVRSAHEAGVAAALDHLERFECWTRRGARGARVIRAGGFVGAAYTHEMSRSGDPHLHTHVVMANVVRGVDERWATPDMRPVYAAAKTAGVIAEAVMRDHLTRELGVEWGPVVNGIADLAAVPEAARAHFSARHAEIVEEAAVRGYTGRAALAMVQRETRDRKRHIDRDRAVAEWRARAAEHGFGELELAQLVGGHRMVPTAEYHQRVADVGERMLGPEGLTLRDSTFTRREVIQHLADAHPDGVPPGRLGGLADAFLARRCIQLDLGREGDPGHRERRYTTGDMLDTERRLLAAGTHRDPMGAVRARQEVVETVIADRPTLGADQEQAVRHLCGGSHRVRVLEARAGSGKTFTLAAVREAYEASGVSVVGVAWQGQAADVLRRDARIPSQTAALLLKRSERGEEPIPHRGVVVVDEASVMPTRPLERLLAKAAAREARVVLVGDRAQLPSIDAGGGFAALADRLGAAVLLVNRRQQSPLQRRVAAHLADGEAAEAVRLLRRSGALRAYDDARDARADLVAAWAKAEAESPGTNLMLAHDRRDVAELNRLARDWRESWGGISDRRMVAGGTEWAVGDRIVCRRNDYGLGVRNGTRGTVTSLDEKGRHLDVGTDHGEPVRLPADYLGDARHGYALTGHVSQGETVDRTFLLASPERGGAEWAYVAASRHRHDLQVFAVHHDPEEIERALADAWARTRATGLALDLIEPPTRGRSVEGLGR